MPRVERDFEGQNTVVPPHQLRGSQIAHLHGLSSRHEKRIDCPRLLPLNQNGSTKSFTLVRIRTDVVWVDPSVADLQIVVLRNEAQENILYMLTFHVGKPIDPLNVESNGEDVLPAGHGIGPHNRMNTGKVRAHVLRSTPGTLKEFKSFFTCYLIKVVLCAGCSETFEEFLVRGGDPIVKLVTRSPQGVLELISLLFC